MSLILFYFILLYSLLSSTLGCILFYERYYTNKIWLDLIWENGKLICDRINDKRKTWQHKKHSTSFYTQIHAQFRKWIIISESAHERVAIICGPVGAACDLQLLHGCAWWGRRGLRLPTHWSVNTAGGGSATDGPVTDGPVHVRRCNQANLLYCSWCCVMFLLTC